MRAWTMLLAGLTIWAVHFVVLYAIASVLRGRPAVAPWLVLAATALAVAAIGLVLWQVRARRGAADPLERWMAQVAALGAGISLMTVVWQAIPALLT